MTPKAYPVFVGRSYQRGRGFGSIMASLFRNVIVPAAKVAIPAAKRFAVPAAKKLGKSIVKAGVQKSANVLENMIQGKSLKEAIKQGNAPKRQNPPKRVAKKRKASGTRKAAPPGRRAKTQPTDIWSTPNKARSV